MTNAKTPLDWKFYKGSDIQADLVGAGDYTISCRKNNFTLSYRPPGRHVPMGSFEKLEQAKSHAESHHNGDFKVEIPEDPWASAIGNNRRMIKV